MNATVKIKSVKINKIVVADKAPVLPYSNVVARASKTMSECRNSKINVKRTGTEG